MRLTDPADHYALLQAEPDARRRLIEDPKRELGRLFGSVPSGEYRIEVIEQCDDTITIIVPAPPQPGTNIDAALEHTRGRIYDILFTDGMGGYLIPDDALTWVLRDMRSAWVERIERDTSR